MSVRHVREDLVLKQLGENGGALGATRWTKSPTPARESDEELELAARAPDASEPGFEQTAVLVGGHGAIPVASPKPVVALEAVFPHGLDGFVMGVEELVKRARAWIPRAVKGRTGVCLRGEGRSCRHGAHGR